MPTIDPFIIENDNPKKAQEWYTDFDHLSLIHENNMPALTETQSTLNYILNVPRAGRYIVVVDYITDRKLPETSIIRINLGGDDDQDGVVTLYPCTYTMVCRQPVIDAESREKVFYMDDNDLRPIEIVVIVHWINENFSGPFETKNDCPKNRVIEKQVLQSNQWQPFPLKIGQSIS